MIRELVKQGNEFLNAFGTKDSVSDGLSPRNITDNLPHVDYNDLKYEFGKYVQFHVILKVTNTIKRRTIEAIVLSPRRIQGQYNYMYLDTGENIYEKVVAVLPITDDVIQQFETLGKTQQQHFRASRMLQYKWRPVHAIAADDVNIDDPEDEKNLLVPDPVEKQHIVQDPNPFSILANYEEIENDENEAQQVLPDQIKNQEAEYAINANQSDFEPNQEDQGATQKIQGAQKYHEKRGARIEVKDVLEEGKSDDESDSDEEEPDLRKEDRERRSTYFNTPTDEEYGRGKREIKKSTSFSFLQTQFKDMTMEDRSDFQHAWIEYQIS